MDFLDIKSRSSFVLALGFGTLIVLIAVLGFGVIQRARAIYNEMESTQPEVSGCFENCFKALSYMPIMHSAPLTAAADTQATLVPAGG